MVSNFREPTTEELVTQRQQELEERRAQVEADKQRRQAEREQRDRNLALAAKANAENEQRRREAEEALDNQGLDEFQIQDKAKLYELQRQIERTSGIQREDLQREHDLTMQRFLAKGRYMGTVTFIPYTIYISTTGHGILIPDGRGNYAFREGDVGAFSSTDKITERDPKTKALKLVSPSMIAKTNLSIMNKWTVVIQDKAPEQVGNKPYTTKFQTPEELQQQKKKCLM